MRTIVKLVAFGVGLSASAWADDGKFANQPQPLGVWDSQGRFVGNLIGQSAVEMVIKGTPFVLPIEREQIPQGTTFYYSTPDCTGQPYLDATTLPISGSVLEGTVYYPGPITSIVQASVFQQNAPGNSNCSPINSVSRVVAPALATQLPAFHPPFCVSPTRKECR